VYFTKQGDRNSFEPLPSTVLDKQVQASVGHFSLGFVGVPLDDDSLDAGVGSDAAEPELDAETQAEAGSQLDAQSDAPITPAYTRITVNSRDRYGVLANQTWAAYQDGDGPWQVLAPPSSNGVYGFDITGTRFAVALVCSDTQALNSTGTLLYEPASSTSVEVITLGPSCTAGTAPASYDIQGTFNLGSSGTSWRMGHARYTGPTQSNGTSVAYNTGDFGTNVANDLIFSVGLSNTDAVSRFVVERDITLATSQTGHYVDSVKGGFARLGVAIAQASGANANTTVDVRYTTRGTEEGIVLNTTDVTGAAMRSISFATLPEAQRAAGDRYLLVAEDTSSTQWRRATWSSYATGNLSVTLPLAFSLSFSGVTTPYFRPVYSFPHQADAGRYAFSFVYSPVRTSTYEFSLDVNPAALEGTGPHQITFPDFSQLAGFNTKWVGPTGAMLSVKGSVKLSQSDAMGTLSVERGQISTLQ